MTVHGLLLAAGAGRRYGGPKALVDGWLSHALDALAEGGCPERTVVLGAEAETVRGLVPAGVRIVVAYDWDEGMGASLRAGLGQVPAVDAVLVHLVDLPDVGVEVVRRVLATGQGPGALARATYAGVPGHPVLLGRDHWPGVLSSATGDRGARAYLAGHDVTLVECGDLATGRDVDR
ncbi:MAG TPA: nucleotidyltransferase family protein [Marmoricola sp.]|nr:nucleotidyltransferase family protein [Marmoricola sp.]